VRNDEQRVEPTGEPNRRSSVALHQLSPPQPSR
jgi:hypothetical protein